MNVILYSTHCPRCLVVENKLKEKKIPYELFSDEQAMLSRGIKTVPLLEVDGTQMTGSEAINWINKQ